MIFEKREMKKFLILTISILIILVISIFSSIMISNNNITFESYDNLDSQALIMIITLDFENNTYSNEIIDVNVYKK